MTKIIAFAFHLIGLYISDVAGDKTPCMNREAPVWPHRLVLGASKYDSFIALQSLLNLSILSYKQLHNFVFKIPI